MRFRVGVVLCLVSLAVVFGCRKPLTPNVDRNLAPETWITAAPQDSLTSRDANGTASPPKVQTIPVRFHLYWAGADEDGTVVAYYYAVVETLATPPAPGIPIPPLPGPKPQDYHRTTKTDSIFIFNVSEDSPDRQHAFFIYAMDDKGKADPTPARFIFNAIDRFPPTPFFFYARATGRVFTLTGTGVDSVTRSYSINDNGLPLGSIPRDTVPANSRLDFYWGAQVQIAGSYVTGYHYKLDEPAFQSADSSFHKKSYNTGDPGDPPIAPGLKYFTLRAVDQAGGAGEAQRRFQMNFSPETWWSGPDPGNPIFTQRNPSQQILDGPFLNVSNWTTFSGIPGSLLSSDSVTVMPARRPERRTFYEIYGDRIYARSEFDTVHINSFVLLQNGGFDRDSKYRVAVDSLDPAIPKVNGQIPQVLRADVENGSPIGFRSRIVTKLDPFGSLSQPAQSGLYPVYEPASVFRLTRIAGYWAMIRSGKAYALARAEDGDNDLDKSVTDAVALADKVDATGGDDDQERELRKRVLVFYVDKAPVLQTGDPAFQPKPGSTITRSPASFNLVATDSDPFNPNAQDYKVGGPTLSGGILRYAVKILGKNADGRDTTYQYYPNPTSSQKFFDNRTFQTTIPDYIVSGPITVQVTVCDCEDCDAGSPTAYSGRGVCPKYNLPVILSAPQQAPAGGASRPGTNSSRSQ